MTVIKRHLQKCKTMPFFSLLLCFKNEAIFIKCISVSWVITAIFKEIIKYI